MTDSAQVRPVEILLVEDSPDDAELTTEALKEGCVLHRLHVVGDGVRALEFLRRTGDYATAPEPDLILLDLDLPRKDGRSVLREIKADDHLKQIPVVVLTGSKAEEDVVRSYRLHANCYISKPVDMEQFLRIVRSLEDFWLTVVKLPSVHSDA